MRRVTPRNSRKPEGGDQCGVSGHAWVVPRSPTNGTFCLGRSSSCCAQVKRRIPAGTPKQAAYVGIAAAASKRHPAFRARVRFLRPYVCTGDRQRCRLGCAELGTRKAFGRRGVPLPRTFGVMLLTPCRSHVRHLGGQKIPLRFESTTSTLLIGTVEHLFVVRDPMTRPRYHEDVEENKNKQQRDDNDEPEKLTTYGHFGCLLQPAPCPVPTESGRGRILAFVMFVNQFLFPVLPHRLAKMARRPTRRRMTLRIYGRRNISGARGKHDAVSVPTRFLGWGLDASACAENAAPWSEGFLFSRDGSCAEAQDHRHDVFASGVLHCAQPTGGALGNKVQIGRAHV